MIRKKNRAPAVMTGVLVVIFAIIILVGGTLLLSVGRSLLSDSGIVPGLSASKGADSPNVERRLGQVIPGWKGTERVNLLLLGVDERPQENGMARTDTMMVLTLDPTTLQAGVLSIPRDLWVPIPGYNQGRINTAHRLGELYNYPGGGPALARETVEYNLGIPIQYYVRLNFQGFVDLIDLIGGIDVYVAEPINDPLYPDNNYGYDPLYIPAGQQHFDGAMALKYARTRHDSNDFERARRQQQVLLAVLERVSSLNLLPQLAPRLGELYTLMDQSVSTDLTLDEVLALAGLAVKVDRSQIRFAVIDSTCTENYITPEGAQVLIPLRDRIREVRDYVFGGAELASQTVEQENATIGVLNGTGRAGLAASTTDYLKEQGVAVAAFGNADRADYATTMIILNRPKPATAARLATLLGLPQSAIVTASNVAAAQDITLILGADYPGPPTSP
ncbi:MAG TPA: LCP family protein [Anaerolineae bacterium]|nr:LCP family protein [Anaerolineae bacterium]HXK43013.1 LCP family protein [Anaerolineae bacterium]